MTKIMVGVEDSARSRDAVAFAAQLATTCGAKLILANAYPHARIPSRAVSAEFDARLHADAEVTLLRMRREARTSDVETRALPDTSAALRPERSKTACAISRHDMAGPPLDTW